MSIIIEIRLKLSTRNTEWNMGELGKVLFLWVTHAIVKEKN